MSDVLPSNGPRFVVMLAELKRRTLFLYHTTVVALAGLLEKFTKKYLVLFGRFDTISIFGGGV